MSQIFDYIVVGAGSSGTAIATRLSENTHSRVLLLEAGRYPPAWDIRFKMPAAKGMASKARGYNWGYWTTPQRHLNDRRITCERGRAMGGSSVINGMAFVRGSRHDYDAWASDPELIDWRYAAVLPYFKRLETFDGGGDFYRGDTGPIHVTRGRRWSPLYDAFIEAGFEAGYPYAADLNGSNQEGFGPMDRAIHRGRRVNVATAYLRDAAGRSNLTIKTGVQVARVLLEGTRCRGVVCLDRAGGERAIYAEREVVLAAGAIGSPQLLLLSGIGDADELKRVGIRSRHQLPGVGQNLHDHLQVFVQQACRRPITLQPTTSPTVRLLVAARWLLTRSGWGATNHFETTAFIRSSETAGWPDIQFHFLPRALPHGEEAVELDIHSFQIHAGPQRSKSRGRLTLRSDRLHDHPLIDPDYMSHPDDWVEMRTSIRIAREVIAQAAFAPLRGEEIAPGPEAQTDAELDAYIRATANTSYHPCGTCKMGSEAEAVVDGQLRVRGLENLRVADSSIIPAITTGNLNAPSIMIGEKAADLICGTSLPPLDDGRSLDHLTGRRHRG
jgi:choline dehydrogenase